MLRASSLGCWPAQSQECRAMIIRTMSSGMKATLLPNQLTLLPNESAVKLSKSAKSKDEQSMSDDIGAEKGRDQCSIQSVETPHVGVHRGRTPIKDAMRFGNRIPGRPFRSEGVNHVAFVPPRPTIQKFPSVSRHSSRKAAHQEDSKNLQLRRVPGEPKPIPRSHVRTLVSAVPLFLQKSLSPGMAVDVEAVQEDPKSLCRSHTASQNPPSVSRTEKLTTKRDVTPTKASKSRTSHVHQIVAKSCTETTESISSTIETQEEQMLHITAESPHHVGRTWRPLPIRPISVPPFPRPVSENDQVRHSWVVLHETTSADDAWNAYMILNECGVPVRLAVLHRMVRLIARDRPRASTEYTRLLEILQRVRSTGGKVYIHEWNTLVDAAGRGWRKTLVRHYETALSFFRDMTKGRAPGTTLALELGSGIVEDETTAEPVEPDIYTYTTLLGIAARTRDPKCLQHAKDLFERSGIPPNRFTHLALIPYFSATSQPGAVRSTLLKLEKEKMQLGLDGINALLWSYGKNRRLDIVTMIYRLLKHNLTADLDDVEEANRLEGYHRQLKTEEFIVVPNYLVPNEVTYVSLIQIMAYHGHLSGALTVFADMLNAPNTERGAFLAPDGDGVLKPSLYRPTAAIFRALFLGFRRHVKPHEDGPTARLKRDADSSNEWTLDNLQQVFDLFMSMPSTIEVGPSAAYWLIVAFQITSNNDKELIRDVWRRVEGRFGKFSIGPNNRLHTIRTWLFSET